LPDTSTILKDWIPSGDHQAEVGNKFGKLMVHLLAPKQTFTTKAYCLLWVGGGRSDYYDFVILGVAYRPLADIHESQISSKKKPAEAGC
jgi:hypothetical protein